MMSISKISAKILFCSFIVFLLSVGYEKWDKSKQLTGEYTFSNIYGKVSNKAKIVLSDGEKTYTLQPENDVWSLKEADNYPINLQLLNTLVLSINKSMIYNYKPTESEKMEFVPEWNIKIFYEDALTDEISVKKNADNRYLAKLAEDEKIYEISGYYEFPHSYAEWLRQPLISLDPAVIRSINVQGEVYERFDEDEAFATTTDAEKQYVANIIKTVGDFRYLNAVKKDKIAVPEDISETKITTFIGLVYHLKFFEEDGKYYVEVEMSKTNMPMRGVSDYIEENKALYEGYLFEVSPEVFEKFLEMK